MALQTQLSKGAIKPSLYSSLYRWAKDGILVPSKIGGVLRYCRKEVDDAIESLKK